QGIVDIALVGEKVGFQLRKLQLGAQALNPIHGITKLCFGHIALASIKGDLARGKHGLPLLFYRFQLLSRGKGSRKLFFRLRQLAHPVKRLPTIEQGLHGLTLVPCFLCQGAGLIKCLSASLKRESSSACTIPVFFSTPSSPSTSFSLA